MSQAQVELSFIVIFNIWYRCIDFCSIKVTKGYERLRLPNCDLNFVQNNPVVETVCSDSTIVGLIINKKSYTL